MHITGQNIFCPYCSNQSLCENLECETCAEKTFATCSKSEHWSDENSKLPSEVFKNSNIKYKFICPSCMQVYEATPSSVMRGCWCICQKNKSEAKLLNFLKSKLTVNIKTQAKFDWCKNMTYLPFDFLIEEFRLIIELDGLQHFSQVRNWSCPSDTQKNDIYKMKCANLCDYSVIRIFQEDVWNDKNDWQTKLMNCIKEYDFPVNIYIGDKYKYPYIKIGSTYEALDRINIDPISYVLKYINTVNEYDYYHTIFFNHKIDYQDTGKIKELLLENPYFHKGLISFIRYQNNKKKRSME